MHNYLVHTGWGYGVPGVAAPPEFNRSCIGFYFLQQKFLLVSQLALPHLATSPLSLNICVHNLV